MSDGKIDYEIGGDSSALSNALQKAEKAGQAAGLQINNALGKLGPVSQAVAIGLALGSAWDRITTSIKAAKYQAEQLARATSNISLAGLNAQLAEAESTIRRLNDEAAQMSETARGWEAIKNAITGTNVVSEQYAASFERSRVSLEGIVARTNEQVRVQTLLNQGKEKEAALLTNQLKHQQQIADLELKRSREFSTNVKAGYTEQIEALKRLQAAEEAGIKKRFDDQAKAKTKIDEHAAVAMELTTELEEQDRHYEAMKDHVGVAARVAHDHRVQAQELVKAQQAWADVMTQGQASQERLEQTTATIGKHFGDQAMALDKLKTAMGIIRGNVEQSAGFWATISEKAQEGVDKARALMATLATVRTTTEAIVTAQVKHTAEVNLSSGAMDKMARNTERTLNFTGQILTTLREINRQATIAGSNIAVLK